jgi:hypothetical protein
VILIGSQAIQDQNGANPLDEFDDTYERLENDTIRSYNSLANIMENQSMQSIVDTFAEKMLQNLIYTDGTTEEGK